MSIEAGGCRMSWEFNASAVRAFADRGGATDRAGADFGAFASAAGAERAAIDAGRGAFCTCCACGARGICTRVAHGAAAVARGSGFFVRERPRLAAAAFFLAAAFMAPRLARLHGFEPTNPNGYGIYFNTLSGGMVVIVVASITKAKTIQNDPA